MRATVFGATGKTGSLVVRECLARGWECLACVRDAKKLDPAPGLRIVEGDTRSLPEVRQAVEEADAIFCCLGMHDITVPATDFSDSVKTIVQAMQSRGCRRIVAIASAGVLAHPTGGYRSKEGLPDFLKNIAAEHIRNHQTLRGSGLDWTLMCAMNLREDIPLGRSKIRYEDLPPGSDETGYADLAHTMVELAQVPASFGKRIGIVSYR